MEAGRLSPPVKAESADGGDGRSPSVAGDGIDIKFQPPVKIEIGETEFISQGVGTILASEDCYETDPLIWTPSERKWHEAEQNGSHSSVFQDDIDIKFQPTVKTEPGETEFMLPTIPLECSELDPLEGTSSGIKCKEENALGRAPLSTDNSISCTATDASRLQDAQKTTRSRHSLRPRRAEIAQPSDETGDPATAGPSSPDVGATFRSSHRGLGCLGQNRLDRRLKKRHDVEDKKGRHRCEWCEYSTDEAACIARHRRTHTGERPYHCDVCGKTFAQQSSLSRHHSVHTGKRPHECDVCGKAFMHCHNLTSHHLTHTGQRPYKCDVCGNAFVQIAHLTRHMRIHTGERPHRCDLCGKAFSRMDKLNYHRSHNVCAMARLKKRRDVEDNKGRHRCQWCEYSTDEAACIARHRRTHTGERPYHCDVCGKTFAQQSSLSRHHSEHTGKRPHECDVCGRAFAHSSNLASHHRSHTGKRPYCCDVCGKAFMHCHNLTSHHLTHTGQKPYKCDVCGNAFVQIAHLTRHMRIHTGERPHRCDLCGKAFSRMDTLNYHRSHNVCAMALSLPGQSDPNAVVSLG